MYPVPRYSPVLSAFQAPIDQSMKNWMKKVASKTDVDSILEMIKTLPEADISPEELSERSEGTKGLQNAFQYLSLAEFKHLYFWIIKKLPRIPRGTLDDETKKLIRSQTSPLKFLSDSLQEALTHKRFNRDLEENACYNELEVTFEELMEQKLLNR